MDFLDSIGVNSAINQRGETLDRTIECAKYLGIRWFRSGIEGTTSIPDLIRLHKEAGVKFSWSPGSGGSDIPRLLDSARQLAKAGALLSFEGPNEPNNWAVTYEGKKGGGSESWLPVAAFQRDMYRAVKADPILKRYPVWGISECGAETDNVGLQFLTVPPGTTAIVPAGTKYADAANIHNYIYHPNAPGLEDNKTWNAADPTANCKVDGLYAEVGLTWGRHYPGVTGDALLRLPRVTTETGVTIDGPITEEIHAKNLLTLYLDQFKRGWSHTAVYLLRDRVDEGGNQQFGFYRPDNKPRLAAKYLHNLTTILADAGRPKVVRKLEYSIPNQPATTHDLLLQKSDGSFYLVVWAERLQGADEVDVRFATSISPVLYDPTQGEAMFSRSTNIVALHLKLTDHPIILAIR